MSTARDEVGEEEESSVDSSVSSEDGLERRGGLRHLACFPAYLETGEGAPRSALIRDLSVTGALLLTRAKLRVGDDVKLALYLGEDDEPFPVQGKVVREERRVGELSHPWTKSVAVQFDAPLTEIEPQIKALAERQAALFGRKPTK